MIAAENQIFRITYEAFSKFSNNLSKCRSLDDVAACFKINLKYLFNFHVFRASYQRGNRYIHLMVTAEDCSIVLQSTSGYFAYETVLLEKGIPLHYNLDIDTIPLPEVYRSLTIAEPELWGWNFKQAQDRQIIVSLLSGKSQVFTKKDISFLKMVAESLESKLLEVCLFLELDAKNQELGNAVTTIHEKNGVITSIMEHQKEIIEQRTQEIATKNARLLEISVLNAHHVREPLSRILGLISVFDYYDSLADIQREVLPKLKISSADLDSALQDVINKATSDLIELKA
ncbi:hypothetical protein AHMF7605_19290 [Adhaeribacter arboris]|uniref:Signal transduction histidine kinase dimerisation/phosphoacceptor domain-containing protein n=1 Tax=Adhaeribacter arboris TaxID=2072846 RepID=A0A2T2YJ15_9BACT|nr:hypothetical protein [Adhaeribacter arboris]PSR55498.1 hypothetical protein AHMF7605_19290 [Adhaeribacter arboris]